MENPAQRFYTIISVLLGALGALLISLPLSRALLDSEQRGLEQQAPWLSLSLIPFLFTIMGGLMGYRKRSSRVFFYLSVITIAVLSSLLTSSFAPN